MFERLLQLLRGTGIPFAAYQWDKAPEGTSYGVIALEGQQDSVPGDNMIQHQSIRGSIDLFVPGISTDDARTVQDVINGVVAWRLNSVQFEDETGLVHYEWIFEQVGF